ncbi:diguanylate cyclase [Actinoplanes hulinensis]|uniref:Diguanylate cyclase n=2 Tax=Actinoplanes hulinensis TaxID=1144547 RepID=A0ABS7B0W7_9ACTN|nr:diguanylate cyclase [Actinoplanes hulinensis]MBW6434686.1 diguanylate cyclase [Actinoplanes hulinensis]
MTLNGLDEVLHDSDRTRVSRVHVVGGERVVRKQPLGLGAADRLRNEIAMLRRLDGVPGTPRLAGEPDERSLTLVDDAARTLADGERPWEPEALTELAVRLAGVLAGIHRRGVVHRDVSPANVLVDDDGRPTLIDFELAGDPGREAGEVLAGTLPYLSPEQTGRTGRPVDHRSDLYALGASLYELATGEPPFGRDREPLCLIHDHLARVPMPPDEVNPAIPSDLSRIILRLLRKEPGQRYQSAEGLMHDLIRLRDRDGNTFELGEHDFPLRLAPPARLIGRDEPLAALHTLLTGVTAGAAGAAGAAEDSETAGATRFALITGPAGVGKTALVDRLRPALAGAGGRFVAGRFDQFHHDLGSGIREAFGRLGEQLLAEPEDVVAELRDRLRTALGPDRGLIAMMMPSFRPLLAVEPEGPSGDDPRVVVARLRTAALTLLRAVASAERPLVLFLDDLQWATGPSLPFLRDVLDAGDLPGLLVLGAYREEEVDETHPLTAIVARAHRIALSPLAGDDLAELIAGMLRLPEADAAPLAAVLAERTGGNPLDTIELVNALRREGVLVPENGGWRWDPAEVRDFVGHGDVVALISARIEALPPRARELVDAMACLGDSLETSAALRPAVDDGLVVVDGGRARFRHDRVRQAAYARLSPDDRARLSLTLARRIAPAPAAAPLYLTAADLLTDPAERASAAALLRRAATSARLVADHAGAELHLSVALRLLDKTDEGYADTRADRHAVLCALARFDEADRVFAEITADAGDPVWLARPVAEQIGALTNRRMLDDALRLGTGLLTRLGVDVPEPAAMGARIGAGLAAFHSGPGASGAVRPELTDPRLLAVAHLINRLVPTAFFADRTTMAWLVVEAGELWSAHGTCAALTGALGHLGVITIAGGGDHRAAYQAICRVLAAGEEHGHEPETSQVRFLHALGTVPWFEPLEAGVRLAHEARDGLLRGGDLRTALYTYFASVPQILDCSADLASVHREARDALAFGERIGAGAETHMFVIAARLVGTMRGETTFDDAYLEKLIGNEPATQFYSTVRALDAAIFGDDGALVRHGAAAVALLPAVPGSYPHVPAHLLAALGAEVTARTATGADRERAMAVLDTSVAFLAARADAQPANFRHLYRFAEATRAAAHGDFASAAAAYDAAMADAATAGRSWHAPLIAERAALFYLDAGLEHVGTRLLAEALSGYARWGATGKVHALKRTHPALGSAVAGGSGTRASTLGGGHSVNLSTEVIDLMAVLEAARALSSETSLDALRVRVRQVLGAMTGATAVHVVLRDDRTGQWVLPGDGDRPEMDADEAARLGLLPLTAIRYAERTREPLLIDDVTIDDRVGRDPYLAGLDHCSLLVVPVIGQGQPRAVLVLENRLSRRAFSAGRLDAVLLVAGQLTVSLENAQVYASLERAVAERTEELAAANHQLELLTVTDPLTGLPNRRKLTVFLDEAWQRAARSREPVGIAMIDIDHFKKYNDHYGHQSGDDTLKLVAEALLASARTTDLVARYGGEEFCIVMPGASPENAMVVAERACRAVSRLAEPHALADGGVVTVSVGVTSGSPADGDEPEHMIKFADEALYAAKNAGRNRVVAG